MKFRRHKNVKESTTPNPLNPQDGVLDAERAIAKQYLDACDPFVEVARPRLIAANPTDAYDAFIKAFVTAGQIRCASFSRSMSLRASAKDAFERSTTDALWSSTYDGPDINESTEIFQAHCNAVAAAHVSTWSLRTAALIDAINKYEDAIEDLTDPAYIASLPAVDAAAPYAADTYTAYITDLKIKAEVESLTLWAIYDAYITDLTGKPR